MAPKRKSTKSALAPSRRFLIERSVNKWIAEAEEKVDEATPSVGDNYDFGEFAAIRVAAAGLDNSESDVTVDPRWDDMETIDAGFKFARRCLRNLWLDEAEAGLKKAFDACQSPIEQLFLAALIGLCEAYGVDFHLEAGDLSSSPAGRGDESFVLLIASQRPIESYRVDFELRYKMVAPDFRTEPVGSKVIERNLIIECDGHEFHENPIAAGTDRERVNRLQELGYRVLRFTGTQLNRNPGKCAADALRNMVNVPWVE
jgi:very-short-patch-repair endonuclease